MLSALGYCCLYINLSLYTIRRLLFPALIRSVGWKVLGIVNLKMTSEETADNKFVRSAMK